MRLPRLPRKTNAMYAAFGDRVMYCRRANDEDRKRGGRLSIYYGQDLANKDAIGKVHLEYYCGSPVYAFGGHIEIGDDEDPVKLAVYVWPFSLYASVETPVARRIACTLTGAKWDGEREIAMHLAPRLERTTVRWSLWHPVHSWESKTPRWRNGSFDLADAILGRRKMRWDPVETVDVSIPMPEGRYSATVQLRDHVCWRVRLPFLTRRLRCANVDIPGGIGFPGKGENAWDCGDDAIFGMSCPAETVEVAIGKVVASVLDKRKRYGGSYEFAPAEKVA